ncbi:DUF4132 domain-containing protein [Bailinhaonella thermotolerans]|uniref:DUF4132 domain-containing protein n=1 Tax=Bailinhaonella thermotolerans TaxID=1070861 RepID=UPI0011C3D85D|nr:DUF4132 domain-containing protein [Bailinhaonella thermotolerans]
MASLDEDLPPEARGWLDEVPAEDRRLFGLLDSVQDRLHDLTDPSVFPEIAYGRPAAAFTGREWRALGLWVQFRMLTWRVSPWRGSPLSAHLKQLAATVGRRRLAWPARELALLWRVAATPLVDGTTHEKMFAIPLTATRRLPTGEQAPYVAEMRRAAELLAASPGWAADSLTRRRLDDLLAVHIPEPPAVAAARLLRAADAFAVTMAEEYGERLGAPAIMPLLRHCATATTARPGDRWLATAADLLTRDAPALVRDVLTALARHRESAVDRSTPVYLHHDTAVLLRGLIWTCELIEAGWVVPVLGDVAVATGTGIGGSGPNSRSELLANAAVAVLAGHGGMAAVAQLARVRARVRRRSLLATVARALAAVGAREGLSPDQLLERTVPSFGLGPGGVRREPAGDHMIELALDEPGPALRFLDADGKVLRNAPKALRENHGDLLADLKTALKELRGTLATERARIEDALVLGREWTWAEAREHYLDHPVTSHLARRLIWQVDGRGAGLPEPRDGGWELVAADGARLRPADGATARLWHPLTATDEEVRAWRDHLMETAWRQPFKQAFREVYPLTPAERESGTFSRRFAGHVLRYGQAKALLDGRGWTGVSLGHWDAAGGSGRCEAVLRRGSLLAELPMWIPEEAWDDADHDRPAQVCVIGEVRFYRRRGEGWLERPLERVPELMFSETMRDIDLAVGVSSIGTDPAWTGPHREYWRESGFGELTESATTRRDALARLLPRLKIADRVELDGRFLRVRGELRTYKIHIGSAGVLMEPDDAHLRVVEVPAPAASVFLPFEEDGLLAAILSKAYLLADDIAITDESLTHQIWS